MIKAAVGQLQVRNRIEIDRFAFKNLLDLTVVGYALFVSEGQSQIARERFHHAGVFAVDSFQLEGKVRLVFVSEGYVADGFFRDEITVILEIVEDLQYVASDSSQFPLFVKAGEVFVEFLDFLDLPVIQEKIVERFFTNAFFKRAFQNVYAGVQPHVEGEAAQDVVEKAVVGRDLQFGKLVEHGKEPLRAVNF